MSYRATNGYVRFLRSGEPSHAGGRRQIPMWFAATALDPPLQRGPEVRELAAGRVRQQARQRPVILSTLTLLAAIDTFDVCVVGAGPVGLALGLSLARRFRRVLLLEFGGNEPDRSASELAETELADPRKPCAAGRCHPPRARRHVTRLGSGLYALRSDRLPGAALRAAVRGADFNRRCREVPCAGLRLPRLRRT